MRLSCSDYTWPLLSHRAALDLVRAIGCVAVDIGFMTNRSHVRPELVSGTIDQAAGRVQEAADARQLVVADVFAIPYTDFETMSVNNPDPTQQERSRQFFEQAVAFARGVGAPGLTTLPGIVFDGDTFANALTRAVDGLRNRVEVAARSGLAVSVEPHTGSLIDSPEKTLALLAEVPGLTITLDYAHYLYGGWSQQEAESVVGHVRHVQCRPGRPGGLQVRVDEDAIDWAQAVRTLTANGYDGFYALEYTWQEWLGCNQVDTVGESILLRDVLLAAGSTDGVMSQ